MKKIITCLAMALVFGPAFAGYIDNRSAPGSSEVEALYKSMPVEDVALGLVPTSYKIVYDSPDLSKKTISVVGKGSWDGLLTKGLKDAQMIATIDEGERVVRVKAIPVPKKDEGVGKAGSAAGGVKAEPVAAALPPQTCTLNAGNLVGEELQKCGVKTGWKLIWSLNRDWTVPATTVYTGDFPTAAGDIVKTLAGNGALIRASIFEGNKTVVVTGPGVAAQ